MASECLVSNSSERLYAKEQYVLDKATKLQIEQGCSWSYRDFPELNYRYFTNIIWSLKKRGRISVHIKSRPTQYRVRGIELPGRHELVNHDHMGDRAEFITQLFKIEGSKEPAIHDIRLVGHATGLHEASKGKGPMNEISEDIRLVDWQLDAWCSVKVYVHKTDSFSVLFGCSNKPIIANALDITRWFIILGRLQEKITTLSGINIPDASLWQVRGLHFNQDMYSGIDLPAGIVICTRDIFDNLIRIYTKQLPNEPKPIVRCEIEETSKNSKPVWQKASDLLNHVNTIRR